MDEKHGIDNLGRPRVVYADDCFALENTEKTVGSKVQKQQRVTFTLTLEFVTRKEGRYFVCGSPHLDVWSQATTIKKAEKNAVEAIQLFLLSCFHRGTMDKVLKDCGFKVAKINKPSSAAPSGHYVDVPLPFDVASACHA